ncbi:MAG: hypothetical protein ACTSRY_06070, partial [Alphaproteobacteria bacterium]
ATQTRAATQTFCNQRAEILAQLNDRYSEAPVAMGLASNGGMIEILTSGNGTTWTIIVTMPNGLACLVAAGEGWERVPVSVNAPRV